MRHSKNDPTILDIIRAKLSTYDKSEILGVLIMLLAIILFKTVGFWGDWDIPEDVQATHIMSNLGALYILFSTGVIVFLLGRWNRWLGEEDDSDS